MEYPKSEIIPIWIRISIFANRKDFEDLFHDVLRNLINHPSILKKVSATCFALNYQSGDNIQSSFLVLPKEAEDVSRMITQYIKTSLRNRKYIGQDTDRRSVFMAIPATTIAYGLFNTPIQPADKLLLEFAIYTSRLFCYDCYSSICSEADVFTLAFYIHNIWIRSITSLLPEFETIELGKHIFAKLDTKLAAISPEIRTNLEVEFCRNEEILHDILRDLTTIEDILVISSEWTARLAQFSKDTIRNFIAEKSDFSPRFIYDKIYSLINYQLGLSFESSTFIDYCIISTFERFPISTKAIQP